MARVEESILIEKPYADIFAFMSAAESHARFIPNMVEFKQTSPGVFGQVGTKIQGTLQILGMKLKVPYQITQFEPERKLAMSGVMGPILFGDGYALDEAGGGTRVTFWLELAPTGAAKLAGPFMGPIGRLHAHETLTNLKRILEKTG